MVPKQVVQRVPLSYYDPFSPAIVNGYSSFSAPSDSSSIYGSTIIPAPSSVVVQPSESTDHSVLSPPKSLSDKPTTEMRRIETGPLETPEANVPEPEAIDPEDLEEIPAPEVDLNSPENDSDESTDANEAGWRIQWTPRFARQA